MIVTEENFVPVLKEIQLSSQRFLFPLQQLYITGWCVRSEHKTTKVMVCTYWWWLSVTAEREAEQDKRSEPVRSVQCAVSRKTQKYINNRHCLHLYRQVSAEGHGHWGSVKSRSESPLQDSRNATSAAMIEICVFQKKVRHIVVRKVVMSKCSI